MSYGSFGLRVTEQPRTTIPPGQAVERLALGMAAANGIVWMKADEATVGMYRRSAHAALILLADIGPTEGQSLGSAHWARTMSEATSCLRHACRRLEDLPGSRAEDEVWLQRLYRAATALEGGSEALSAADPGPEEMV